MELKDLVGEHTLDAVDFSTERLPTYGDKLEDCNVMRFRLDGVVYVAIEDPEDGYRSSMKELKIDDAKTMTNVFPPIKVIGKHRTEGEFSGEDDVLELIDAVTGKIVIEVGTDDIDDYYPGFVSNFRPEAMVTNRQALCTRCEDYAIEKAKRTEGKD